MAALSAISELSADTVLSAHHEHEHWGDVNFLAGLYYFEALARSHLLTCGMDETQEAHLACSLYFRFNDGIMLSSSHLAYKSAQISS